jgi:hypothetical protein
MAPTKGNLGQHRLRPGVVIGRLWRLAGTYPHSHGNVGTAYTHCNSGTAYPYTGAAGTDTDLAAYRSQRGTIF